MRWESGRRSDNIEDRRGMRIPGGFAGGGIGVVVIALIAMFFGVDPRLVLEGAGQLGGAQPQQQAAPTDPAQDRLKDFVIGGPPGLRHLFTGPGLARTPPEGVEEIDFS